MMSVVARGNAVSVATPLASETDSTVSTPGSASISLPLAVCATLVGSVSVTALWWRERDSRLDGVPSATMRRDR